MVPIVSALERFHCRSKIFRMRPVIVSSHLPIYFARSGALFRGPYFLTFFRPPSLDNIEYVFDVSGIMPNIL